MLRTDPVKWDRLCHIARLARHARRSTPAPPSRLARRRETVDVLRSVGVGPGGWATGYRAWDAASLEEDTL